MENMDQQLIDLKSPVFQPRPGWGGKLKNWSNRNRSGLLTLAAMAIVLVGVGFIFNNDPDVSQATPTPTPNAQQVSVTAQQGDSVTTLARRALNMYLLAYSMSVSDVQELFIETQLKSTVGEFRLSVGQTIDFSVASIERAIEAAQKMTPYQLQYYSQFVK